MAHARAGTLPAEASSSREYDLGAVRSEDDRCREAARFERIHDAFLKGGDVLTGIVEPATAEVVPITAARSSRDS